MSNIRCKIVDMSTPAFIRAHQYSSWHRKGIENSETCGCFYCLAIFKPLEIQEWVDEYNGIGQTALCPKCGIDSVIGSHNGFPISVEFLKKMKQYWF